MLDMIIKNGFVVDGAGNPWVKTDLGIDNQKIKEMGNLSNSPADRVIDAKELVVTPGFIDIHAHSDYLLLGNPYADNKIMQGITTDVGGTCGYSCVPLGKKWLVDWWVENERDQVYEWDKAKSTLGRYGIDPNWSSVKEYLDQLEQRGIALNYLQFVGQHSLRAAVLGDVIRKPSEEELEEMKSLLDLSMREGAFGLSTGFDIEQEADTEEFIELCKVASSHNGFYACHIRSYGDKFIESIREAIEISEKAQIRTSISHINILDKENWGKARTALNMIHEARRKGIEILIDQKPAIKLNINYYSPELDALLPQWIYEDGEISPSRLRSAKGRERLRRELKMTPLDSESTAAGEVKSLFEIQFWEDIFGVFACPTNPEIEGKTFAEISKLMGVEPFDAVLNLIIEEKNIILGSLLRDKEDVFEFMKSPLTMFGSDAGVWITSRKENQKKLFMWERLPAEYEFYPQLLRSFVTENQILTLEETIRKMTSMPACFLGLYDRGLIKKGMYADIVIFDRDKIKDRGLYTEYPSHCTEGMEYVIVNGEIAYEKGRNTETLNGKVLRLKH